MVLRLKTRSEDDTFALGRALGACLRPGDTLLLSGDLGTGKSVLARGAARALGVEGPMPSPSFTILFPYEGKCPVYHFDLYRLGSEEEVLDLGFDEIFFGGEGVCAVEWCEVAGSIFAGARAIDVTLQGEGDERTILLEGMHGTFDVGRLVQHGIRVRDEG